MDLGPVVLVLVLSLSSWAGGGAWGLGWVVGAERWRFFLDVECHYGTLASV